MSYGQWLLEYVRADMDGATVHEPCWTEWVAHLWARHHRGQGATRVRVLWLGALPVGHGGHEQGADDERAPDCIDCGDPEAGTCPGQRCRDCDCDIEHVQATGSCRECLRWITTELWQGEAAYQHRPGCSLAHSEDWSPRTDEELAAVREARARR